MNKWSESIRFVPYKKCVIVMMIRGYIMRTPLHHDLKRTRWSRTVGVNLNLRQPEILSDFSKSSEHCSILTSPVTTGFTYGFQTQTFSYHTYFHCTEDERVPGRLPPAYRSAFSRELKSISVLWAK